ncbi:DUF4190 domain-containing protein [Mycolicibacterium pulveris]|uniref:DUF4190 domain-containing protein n=1 Tax=Mycolicibacterium pulveris TaxID=36813 RepID=UPI003CF65502
MSEPDRPETPPPTPPPPAPGQYGPYPGNYPPPPPYSGYLPPPSGPKNGFGIASLVIAIVALVSVIFGVVLGVVAIIFGFLGWGRAKRGEATNGGMAVAGIILGILSIIEAIAAITLLVWGFDRAGGTDYLDCVSQAGNDQVALEQCANEFQQRVDDQFSVTVEPTP